MIKRIISIELERALVYLPHLKQYPPLGSPYGSCTPFSFQSFMHKLMKAGWEPIYDATTGVVLRVKKNRKGEVDDANFWTCSSDVTTGIFETTLPPQDNIASLEKEQKLLDASVLPILGEEGLFIWYTEASPVTKPTRQYYTLFHTYWRWEYSHLRQRGMDHYWFAWVLGNNPSLDISVQEAIPFLRVIIRLTSITFFLIRLGAISAGTYSANKMLTIRPWAWKNLFLNSPYPDDLDRVGMPDKEITSWHSYFSYLMSFRMLTLFFDDGLPYRVFEDPSFYSFWKTPPPGGWRATAITGKQIVVDQAELINLEKLQRQAYISRFRFNFSPEATLNQFGVAFSEGEAVFEKWLTENLQKLYIEVRSDSCPPKGEEFATLALYLGLLTNLSETTKYVVDKFPYDFWKKLFSVVDYAPLDSKIDNISVIEVLEKVIELSKKGLIKRGLGEEQYLKTFISRIKRKTSPAEESVAIFEKAGEGQKGIAALAQNYGLFPK
ncbi:hypothetical protein HYS97_01935 [Candidatus Daviesbacteria bacterium]|nr:hypothetical protein [Candidatus Daviesbacteria bacterium]